ncbi:MAG: DUF2505 family protein, partial [Myxococcota bacterium]
MERARISHTYDCDEDTFWREIMFDSAFNRRLYLEHLNFKDWRLEHQDETDQYIRREVFIHPTTGDVPKPLLKVVGDNLSFRERGSFDKRTKRYQLEIVTARLPEKIDIKGELWLEARAPRQVDRVFEMTVSARIFGMGGLIEKRIVADTVASYEQGWAYGQAA